MSQLRVHADGEPAGSLVRTGRHGSVFRYDEDIPEKRAVSVTMPVQLASYDLDFGLHPVFDMNLPEGRLRDHLLQHFRKAAGTFDDFDLLSVVGRSQIGRLRYSAPDEPLDEAVPFQSVDELLRARRGGDLLEYLLNTFSKYSGISGVQPKVLIRDSERSRFAEVAPAIIGATHIVKLWEPESFPELAANEYFCLQVAEKAGIPVPSAELAEDGSALVVERFDLRRDGTYRGIEDFCCLNGFGADRKYKGGYERGVFRRASEFMPESDSAVSEALFKMIVLNTAVRNGDAHLKNFAVLYDDPQGTLELAPMYDVVTTSAYLPQDQMALTLDGRPNWPNREMLRNLGRTRTNLSESQIGVVLQRTLDAISDTARQMAQYAKDRPEFEETFRRMKSSWDDGARSLTS